MYFESILSIDTFRKNQVYILYSVFLFFVNKYWSYKLYFTYKIILKDKIWFHHIMFAVKQYKSILFKKYFFWKLYSGIQDILKNIIFADLYNSTVQFFVKYYVVLPLYSIIFVTVLFLIPICSFLKISIMLIGTKKLKT